jgi:hypothetical protein
LELCPGCGVAIVADWKAVEQHNFSHGDERSTPFFAALEKRQGLYRHLRPDYRFLPFAFWASFSLSFFLSSIIPSACL